MYKKQLTKEQALQKLRHYCGYQERCGSEVKEKLYSLGVSAKEYGEIISILIEENCLDEERFAIAYTSGKFRIKQWGRIKIKHALLQKQVSEYYINKALKQIDEKEYKLVIKNLSGEKYTALRHEQYLVRKKKTMDYLIGKGYEPELVNDIVRTFSEKNKKKEIL
ncbi:MAG TPA: regulatory protein RecX [Chitinophagaceae bacterium]|nr:regulatory protein RecX [Chitinophagaceae bacterium]